MARLNPPFGMRGRRTLPSWPHDAPGGPLTSADAVTCQITPVQARARLMRSWRILGPLNLHRVDRPQTSARAAPTAAGRPRGSGCVCRPILTPAVSSLSHSRSAARCKLLVIVRTVSTSTADQAPTLCDRCPRSRSEDTLIRVQHEHTNRDNILPLSLATMPRSPAPAGQRMDSPLQDLVFPERNATFQGWRRIGADVSANPWANVLYMCSLLSRAERKSASRRSSDV